MTTETKYTALWHPSWHELDQSLMIGQKQKYSFFRQPPAEYQTGGDDVGFVFYNQLESSAACDVRYATVVEISHPVVGELSQIDTNGLDYLFVPMSGKEIVVNAEEEPGTTYEGGAKSGMQIQDWSIRVTLSEVSEPLVETDAV